MFISLENKDNDYIIRNPDYSEFYTYNQSLKDILINKLKFNGDKIWMIDAETKETLTFNDALTRSIKTAVALKRIGIKQNDVIGISSENNINFFIPAIAAALMGAIVLPLNPNYTLREILHMTNITKPKLMFYSHTSKDNIHKLYTKADYVQNIINLDNLEDFMSESYIKNIDQFYMSSYNPEEQTYVIMSSSGTTGLPKGVMLTHLNFLVLFHLQFDPIYSYKKCENQTQIGLLPFFHTFGFVTGLSAIMTGSKLVLLKTFKDTTYLKTIQDYKINVLWVVPPIIVFLAKSNLLNNYDLSSVKFIGCASAPFGKDVKNIISQRFKNVQIVNVYGMTETTTVILAPPKYHPRLHHKINTVGQIYPYMKCKVFDQDCGKSLGPNKMGELCFKGPLVMKGYYKNAEATKAVFDEEGWLHSGDIGYYDEDNCFYIVDRIKDVIKYKGFGVAPAELENVLLTHPCVKDVAVVGKPDERSGELSMAFVVKQNGKDITEQEIIDFMAEQMSPQKRLHGGIEFIDEIPKNPSGKIMRRLLREKLITRSRL